MKTYLNDFFEPVLVFSIGALFVLAVGTAFVGEDRSAHSIGQLASRGEPAVLQVATIEIVAARQKG
ncbi:hypothetical protein [Chitinimonas taiwanensis]|jgi:hypothetical protein|uniref:Uncharacterized protein n=1 Tax=Chitinimonas taiwanensis DSM 18899 TaxID=1121279 RepID=A0A1K2H9M1_9NEIS|nr:hypothetical protein [Chitinimonas taiwanensis]SFZ73496.1 hypothetical protein SAMN02745887_00857 [Chitinimonas taiwanensis DSM 18899]